MPRKEQTRSDRGSARADPRITERILAYLASSQFSSISEIAIGAKTTRITARKHLERLVRKGVLLEREMGQFRIFYKNMDKLNCSNYEMPETTNHGGGNECKNLA